MRCIYAEKSVSIFQPDVAYTFADAYREYDYLIVAEMGERCSLIAVEEVSGGDEWTKRIIDLKTAIPLVVWESSNNIRLKKAVPGIVSTRGLAEAAKKAWSKIENRSIIARWMASEPFNLIFWSALNLAPSHAELILNDVQRSAGNRCDSHAMGDAFKHLHMLAEILEKVLKDEGCISVENADAKHEPEPAEKIFDKILAGKSLILAYPQLVQYEDEVPFRVERQKDFLLKILEKYHQRLSRLILMSNESLEKQCSYIRRELENNINGACRIGEVKVDNREDLDRLEGIVEECDSILNLVLQDYNKRLLLDAFERIVKPEKRVYLMVVPEVRFRVKKPFPDNRLQQAQLLYRMGVNEIKACEVTLLEPEELVVVVELLRRSRS